MTWRTLIPPLISLVLMLALAVLGLPEWLGAHPYWSVQVAFLGAVPGVLLWALARKWPRPSALASIAFAALAAGVTARGKAAFAASFAEDAVAGRMWYFGWIGLSAALIWTVAALLDLRKSARKPR